MSRASDGPLRTMRVLWGAIFASSVGFAGVVAFLRAQPPRGPAPVMPPVMPVALGAVALAVAVMSFVLPARFYATAVRNLASQPPDGEFGGEFGGGDVPPTVLRRLTGVFQTTFVLSVALSEAVSLFGVVLGILGAPWPIVAPFFAAGSLLILIRFPTHERIVEPYRRARR